MNTLIIFQGDCRLIIEHENASGEYRITLNRKEITCKSIKELKMKVRDTIPWGLVSEVLSCDRHDQQQQDQVS